MSSSPRTSWTNSAFLAVLAILALGVVLGGCRQWPDCKKDEHCTKYEQSTPHGTPYCVDRICRECIDDGNCGFCEQCAGNSCMHIPGCCGDDSDCTAPMICRDGRCGPECLSDAECEELEVCRGGECTQVECTSDEHCAEGFRCENNSCQPIPDNTPCADRTFDPIYFDFDESTLRADQSDRIDENLACFNRFEGDVNVEGHCDERGTTEYNLALGDRRARSIRNWYEDNGVPRSRMNKISYGESRPASSGHSESAWRQNRRVETVWR